MPKGFNVELEEIEAALKSVMGTKAFKEVKAIHDDILNTIGNVDGDEVLALALLP
jgi:hypothetical protein